jgi:hypothetical protein
VRKIVTFSHFKFCFEILGPAEANFVARKKRCQFDETSSFGLVPKENGMPLTSILV